PRHTTTQRVIDEDPLKELKAMLVAVIENGTGHGAKLSVPAAGKTGTSQDYRDAWFLGFTDDLVTGVWLGNDDNQAMKRVTGGSLPAMTWHDIMTEAEAHYDPSTRYTRQSFGSVFESLLNRLVSPVEYGPQYSEQSATHDGLNSGKNRIPSYNQ